jgi:uncharacterized protein (DUF488 family)
MSHTFFTIGHSTHALAEFIGLLQSADVRLVADVRTIPRSRANPQFNRDELAAGLTDVKIDYEHMAALGGLRGKQPGFGESPNTFWQNDRFRNYADYAMTQSFSTGLTRLRSLGAERTVVIMCAEALWWRCHRRIIADYLLANGEHVIHILSNGRLEAAQLTSGAQPAQGGVLVYPREQDSATGSPASRE